MTRNLRTSVLAALAALTILAAIANSANASEGSPDAARDRVAYSIQRTTPNP